MSWSSWLCSALVIIGAILFLVGANVYNAFIGWGGVFVFIGGIMLYLIFYIYYELKKETVPIQKP
jgi:hypothetical protein